MSFLDACLPIGIIVVLIANTNRSNGVIPIEGMPWAVLVMLAILFLWTMLLGRTRFGRYVYAIGGNAEAARRAGINIVRIRTLAFLLCGLTAGMTGIIYASYLGSISSNVPGGQNVLNAVAAAVIQGGMVGPAVRRLKAAGEAAGLRKTMARGNAIASALLMLAFVCMIAARFL